jgi:acetyl esterase/lipase
LRFLVPFCAYFFALSESRCELFAYRFGLTMLAWVVAMNFTLPVSVAEEPTVITLWDGVAPGSEQFTGEEQSEQRSDGGRSDIWVTGVNKPTLTVVAPPEAERNGSAVVICPGGAYAGLSFDKEGLEIGQWFADMGITAFVLKYRHGGGVHQHPVPLSDIQRAVRLVRSQADQWKIVPERIGVMGFSAGGHLAASAGTHFDAGTKDANDLVKQQSCRPDFLVLVYPVISMDSTITHGGSRTNLLGEKPDEKLVALMSNELQVTDKTPPTFIVHASDDGAVPVANALRFYQACVDHKVPAELHMFEKGGHGFGMRQKGIPVEEWPSLLANWLKSRGLAE